MTAVASSTGTSSLPRRSKAAPLQMNRAACSHASATRTILGRNSFFSPCTTTRITSFSSYSRFISRAVCSGTVTRRSAFSYENEANAAITPSRVPT